MKKLLVALLFIVAIVFTSNAQKVKIKKGDLNFLKGQNELLVEFNYDDMGIGKYDKEEDYINKKVSDYNAKEPGKGDMWEKAWYADREEHYEPKFELLFSKGLEDINIEAGPNYTDAKYTLILKTYFIEPGYNIGISKKNASMSSEAIFVETANPDNVICQIDLVNAPGRGGGDYDSGVRVGEAYAKCGKTLAAYLVKKLK